MQHINKDISSQLSSQQEYPWFESHGFLCGVSSGYSGFKDMQVQ